MLNENKQVISWHFTKKEQFSFVEDILKRLHERNGTNIELFILDNCCKWGANIKRVFGNVSIKLDPFHAIQRITSTIRKAHPFHKQMVNDLEGLLRQNGDSGVNRKEATIESTTIMNRLHNVVEKWTKLEHLVPNASHLFQLKLD